MYLTPTETVPVAVWVQYMWVQVQCGKSQPTVYLCQTLVILMPTTHLGCFSQIFIHVLASTTQFRKTFEYRISIKLHSNLNNLLII